LLALVIHELATNAAKYGALACAGGQLTIVTKVNDGILQLAWTETGGPALAGPPTRRGFGTILTDRALRLPLAAKVERIWAASGLTVTISVPCANLAH
jgi:two-component sensor histidine kinase